MFLSIKLSLHFISLKARNGYIYHNRIKIYSHIYMYAHSRTSPRQTDVDSYYFDYLKKTPNTKTNNKHTQTLELYTVIIP